MNPILYLLHKVYYSNKTADQILHQSVGNLHKQPLTNLNMTVHTQGDMTAFIQNVLVSSMFEQNLITCAKKNKTAVLSQEYNFQPVS